MLVSPGARLAPQTALALQEAGVLEAFVTSYYFAPKSYLVKIVESLPEGIRNKILRELKRRYLSGLNVELVKCFPQIEIPLQFLSRVMPTEKLSDRVSHLRAAFLKSKYKSEVSKERPAVVITCDGWAKPLFNSLHSEGFKVLDQNTGHVALMAATFAEERRLRPDLKDSIPEIPEALVQDSIEEALAADMIFASSDFVRDSLVNIGVCESKIRIIQYGCDTARFCPGPKDDRNSEKIRFLFVGLIGQRKGITYLLQAFKELNLPNAELHLVGIPVGCEKVLAEYEGYFTHVPSVPHHEIHQVFQNADIFVMPSLHEGSALVSYEALSSGLPVITTINSGTVVRDGREGYVLPIRDVEALKDRMKRLYDDKNLRLEMANNARTRALEFTWERYRQKVGQAVIDLISGR